MYQVIWLYDGCPDMPAAIPMATIEMCTREIRIKYTQYEKRLEQNHKVGLGIVDLETERLVSFVL